MQLPWELVRAEPAPDLVGAVIGYTGYRETGAPGLTRLEPATTIIPLIINFGAPFVTTMADGAQAKPAGFPAGVIDRPVLVSSQGAAACVQIDFTLAGAYRFFHLDPREMAGRIVALEDLGLGGQLVERLESAPTWDRRFALVEAFVRHRLATGRDLSVEIAGAVTMLHGGGVRIRDIAAAIGWSERHLARRFAAETGVRPKTVARILRFETARRRMTRAQSGGWADIALASGYADQAHLIREFRLLSGLCPTAMLAQDASMPGFF